MKYIDEFRNIKLAKVISEAIFDIAQKGRTYNIMEVCGTHTMNVFRFGIKKLLPGNINLMAGPGCPVCVSAISDIDTIIEYSKIKGVIIATFGDMLKVPGSNRNSLYRQRSQGSDVRVVYCVSDALEIAVGNLKNKILFLGVGFETTAPTIAMSILEAKRRKLKNYFVFSVHKIMPPALNALCEDQSLNIDGFMLPGHVSAILGARPYGFLVHKHNKACVIAGFEPVDILDAIYRLIRQINGKKPAVEIQYDRVVAPKGNSKAIQIMSRVFDKRDSLWRGLGCIKKSGLKISSRYESFDIEKTFKIKVFSSEPKGCICSDVIRGVKKPDECKFFARGCTPLNPIGACMVSREGTCATFYKYIAAT